MRWITSIIPLTARELPATTQPVLGALCGCASPRVGKCPASAERTQDTAGRPSHTEVREWTKVQGMGVKDRGRVPAELVAKFKTATGK